MGVNFPEEKRCVTLEWGAGGGVSNLLEKRVTKIYGSMLLALRRGRCQFSSRKALHKP